MRFWHRFSFSRRLDIDYVPSRSHRRIALGLLGIAVSLWVMIFFVYQQENEEIRILHETLQRMPKYAGIEVPTKRVESAFAMLTKDEKRELEQISRKMNMPWDNIFRGLQRAGAARIALLEVTPDPDTHRLRMVGEAPRANEVWEYMTRLSLQPGFSQVVLVEHEFRQDQPQQPIRFVLDLKW